MTTHREGIFVDGLWKEDLKQEGKVDEIGLTSAPLLSIAYHFQKYCKDFSEDFMLCKNQSTDPNHCLLEGRKVTRCGQKLVEQLKLNCDQEWKDYYVCLDESNQMMQKCRKPEQMFNSCVYKKMVPLLIGIGKNDSGY